MFAGREKVTHEIVRYLNTCPPNLLENLLVDTCDRMVHSVSRLRPRHALPLLFKKRWVYRGELAVGRGDLVKLRIQVRLVFASDGGDVGSGEDAFGLNRERLSEVSWDKRIEGTDEQFLLVKLWNRLARGDLLVHQRAGKAREIQLVVSPDSVG